MQPLPRTQRAAHPRQLAYRPVDRVVETLATGAVPSCPCSLLVRAFQRHTLLVLVACRPSALAQHLSFPCRLPAAALAAIEGSLHCTAFCSSVPAPFVYLAGPQATENPIFERACAAPSPL